MWKEYKKYVFWTIFGIFGLALVYAGFDAFYRVQQGYVGVVLTNGKANPVPSRPGLNFKIPYIQDVIMMDVKTHRKDEQTESSSKDIQIVKTYLVVAYHLLPESAPKVFGEIGLDYAHKLIQPAVHEVLKATTAKFSASELITKRSEVKMIIDRELKKLLLRAGIQFETASIKDFKFSQGFNDAIEEKVKAEQEAQRAERDLIKIKVEKQQKITRAEADNAKNKLEAEAQAYARKVKADAEAYAIKAEAEAKALALKKIGDELRKNQKLIEYNAVEKWDGTVPHYMMGGGGAVPFVNIGPPAK